MNLLRISTGIFSNGASPGANLDAVLFGAGLIGFGSQVNPWLLKILKSLKLLLASLPWTGISFHPLKPSAGQTKACKLVAGLVRGVASTLVPISAFSFAFCCATSSSTGLDEVAEIGEAAPELVLEVSNSESSSMALSHCKAYDEIGESRKDCATAPLSSLKDAKELRSSRSMVGTGSRVFFKVSCLNGIGLPSLRSFTPGGVTIVETAIPVQKASSICGRTGVLWFLPPESLANGGSSKEPCELKSYCLVSGYSSSGCKVVLS